MRIRSIAEYMEARNRESARKTAGHRNTRVEEGSADAAGERESGQIQPAAGDREEERG